MPKRSSKNKQALATIEPIEPVIRVIRGQRVILDVDLAAIYGTDTRSLVQAVKRNLQRFPDDFVFQLTAAEDSILRSQIVISKGRGGNHRTVRADKKTPQAVTATAPTNTSTNRILR